MSARSANRIGQAPEVRVRAASDADEEAARALAERLSPPIDDASAGTSAVDPSPVGPSPATPSSIDDTSADPASAGGTAAGSASADPAPGWTLHVDGARRALERPDGVRLELDFTAGRTAARQRETGLARQPLARALGVTRLRRRLGRPPAIVEATGGLGRDAWFAASLGCPVTVIERSPIVHALLESALERARATPETAETAARVTLLHGEAGERLGTLERDALDVVYLDPMYPPVRRRAAVAKGMQFLHELLGPPDAESARRDGALFRAALDAARRHVAVKRPSGAPAIAGEAAFDGQRETIESPGTRYDLYLL